jgi:RHS repeat-associated protein
MACFHYAARYESTGFLGFSYYNPEVGRFDKSDLLFLRGPERCFERPEECQLYSYVANGPTRWVDVTGELIFNYGTTYPKTQKLIYSLIKHTNSKMYDAYNYASKASKQEVDNALQRNSDPRV